MKMRIVLTCFAFAAAIAATYLVARAPRWDQPRAAAVQAFAALQDRGPGGRLISGMGAPYEPTDTTPDAVNRNMAVRRDVAWAAVAKVFTPYEATLVDGGTDTIPAFLSWYIEDEIEIIMEGMVDRFGVPEAPGFTDDQIREYFNNHEKALREGLRDFAPVARDVITQRGDGIPHHIDTSANMFSPGFMMHIMKHIREIADCDPDDMIDYIQEKMDGLRESFSPCMSREFPRDAIAFKPGWRRVNDANMASVSQAFPTDPNTMRLLLGQLQDGEMRVDDMPNFAPDPGMLNAENFFVVEDSNGERYALQNLHVVTKEIDEWVWGTIWWSPTAEGDLGSDRPTILPEALQNYKLCVATTFMEQDDTPPEQRFPEAPELATVMGHATWPDGPMNTNVGTASWCANPYVEGGFHEQTCLGCHQPAGERAGSSNVRNVTRHLGDFIFTFSPLRTRADLLLER